MHDIHDILKTLTGGRLVAWSLCLAALGGCTVGPDFVSPSTEVPKAWAQPTTRPATQPAEAPDLARWWKAFNDPLLSSLVERAMESNLDLRLAQSRIRQARASRGIAVSGLGPSVAATGSYSRGQSGSGTPVTGRYQAGFDAGWEIDIFGGVRRGIEAADAQLQATIEDRRSVQVTLTGEIASLYVQLRSLQQRIAFARKNLQIQTHSADLTRQRFEGGFVSGLDVANAQAQVATTRSQIPLLESSARQTLYAIEVLMDRPPGAMAEELSQTAEIPYAPPDVPLGLPADLLRRRPDIRRAEADAHAATANIGVATADLFPRVTINASLGWQADSLSSLLTPASRFWSFGPAVTWNAFQSGRVLSNIEVQKALQEQSILAYRQTVLAAILEVENALVASAKEQEHRKALIDAVAANRRAVQLAGELYTQGNTDFLNVLSAQQGLLNSEDALVQSTAAISTNLIALYKALGGGWEETAPGGQK